MLITPSGSLTADNKHQDGINVYEFEDLAKGKLKRDASGNLILFKRIGRYLGAASGMGDYDEGNTYGGIVMSDADITAADGKVFRLFSTKEKIS